MTYGYAEPERGLVAGRSTIELDGVESPDASATLWVGDRFIQQTEDGPVALLAPPTLLGTPLLPLALLDGAVRVSEGPGDSLQVLATRDQLMQASHASADDVAEALDIQGMSTWTTFQADVVLRDGHVHSVHLDHAWDAEADGLTRTVMSLHLEPAEPKEVVIPDTVAEMRLEEFLMDLLGTLEEDD